MKKRMYRRVPVKEVEVAGLCEKLATEVVVVGLDVAKHDMVAAFATAKAGVVSSGAHRGRLSLTKRGSSRARKYLWFAVLRWVQTDEIAKAYYKRKVARDGGRTMPALGALMRKLVKALYHVARGEPLDASKLFDVSRLELPNLRSSTLARTTEVTM